MTPEDAAMRTVEIIGLAPGMLVLSGGTADSPLWHVDAIEKRDMTSDVTFTTNDGDEHVLTLQNDDVVRVIRWDPPVGKRDSSDEVARLRSLIVEFAESREVFRAEGPGATWNQVHAERFANAIEALCAEAAR